MKIKKMVPRSIKDSLKFLRISKPVTRVLGSPYPPPDHRKLQLDITYACNLTCPSCNRSSPQARAKDEMTMEQIEKFIEESVDSGRMWRQIKIMGGEPTLHPRFFEIMDLLREWRDKYSADTEICVKTNGEGPRVLEVLSRVPGDVMVRRSPKEYVIEDFYGYNIAPVDLPLYRLFADFSAGCFIPRNCGIGLNKYGYYTCGNGAGVARVFGMDIARQELPDETDEMRDQMKALCGYCGAFHHFISIMRPKDPFYVSETWARAFEAYKRAKPELPEWKAR